ncbi:GNAT family N-acetyltransferase [Candidatus Woesearchaeota archaeon]|nr:GNAT family N-acetyltransferase [Candidatus Woesearchaeota archaeon]
MKIRKAVLKDKEALAQLYLQFWKAHSAKDPLIELEKKWGMKEAVKDAEKDISKRCTYIFVAEEKGRVIGMIEVIIKKNFDIFKVKRFGYVNTLVIDTRHRKSGIGRKLVNHAAGFLKKKSITYMRVNVYASNKKAKEAWLKMGFMPESQFMLKRI